MVFEMGDIDHPFGTGQYLSTSKRYFEQAKARDSILIRICKMPDHEENNASNSYYEGTLYKRKLSRLDDDHYLFANLTGHLQRFSGNMCRNLNTDYLRYVLQEGLEYEVENVPSVIRINRKDVTYPDRSVIGSYLNRKSDLGRLMSAIPLILPGAFAVTDPAFPLDMDLVDYSLNIVLADILSASGLQLFAPNRLCGIFQLPGYAFMRSIYKNKLLNPDQYFGRFISFATKLNHETEDLENIPAQNSLKSLVDASRMMRHVNRAQKMENLMLDIFDYTKHQKGLSITYQSPDYDEVVSFMSYLLTKDEKKEETLFQELSKR